MAYRQGQVSKYRNYKAAPLHQKFHIDNLHNIATTCPSESELIQANADRVAVPLNKAGGKIAVFELSKPGRQVGGVIPALVHGSKVMDFMWDPFDKTRLVVGCDDGRLWVWSIPSNGLQESTNTPEYIMNAHSEKIYFVRFHPLASNVLATGSQDFTIRIWHLSKQAEMILIQIPPENVQVFTFAWSSCGAKFATASKDGKVRLYEPRLTTSPLLEAQGPTGVRGGRVVWVLDSRFLILAGFDRFSERQLHMYSATNLERVITISLDSSPAVLIPFYDEDSSVLLLSGRGDVTIFAFDVVEDPPFIRNLGHHRCSAPHQGISFLKKISCDVRSVEFAKALRLTESAIEPWSFTVPRVKSEYFQEDLFPPTKCLWEATMESGEWFSGQNVRPKRINLKPLHMKSTSILPENRWRSGSMDSSSGRTNSIDISDPLKVMDWNLSTFENKEEVATENVAEELLSQDSDSTCEFDITKKISSVPEPLPRKKSLSSGSSSDELTDTSGRPIPRPRFKTNGIPMLRTPSSFLTKRIIHLNRGSSSPNEDEDASGTGLPSYAEAMEMERNSKNSLNGNNQRRESDQANDNIALALEIFPISRDIESKNSNEIETTTVVEELPVERQQTVAERMKIYSQSLEDSSTTERKKKIEKEHDGVTVEVISKSPDNEIKHSHSAPFLKPERKYTQGAKTEEKGPVRKRIDTVFGQVSKYRNFKAVPLHKKFHIENLRTISTTCPSESELIQGNPERVAVPLSTPGGKLAIFEISKPGRQPDGVIPALVHGAKIMDFNWDPFNDARLAVGTDSGRIYIWTIPSTGLIEQTNEPDYSIYAHAEKIFFTRFHPLAKDVLASGSFDLTIRIWDLETKEAKIVIQLEPSQIQIFSFAWSPSGSKFVTACKDGKVRLYEPRDETLVLFEAQGPAGVRGGRVIWVLDGRFIVVAGFDRSSERQLHMYSSNDLTKVFTTSLDVSPAILVPFYDEDSSLLLLSGRGDSTIFSFDVVEEPPSLCKLSDHRCTGAHQGISFLKKIACDVRSVEFAKGLRLTESAVEPWSFTVPRVKNEFFQDDIFPPTKCLWEFTMTSSEWFAGQNLKPKLVSLKPSNMKSVGEVSFSSNATVSIHIKTSAVDKIGMLFTDKAHPDHQKAKEAAYQLENAIKQKMILNMELEQDSMEGVDETDWM